MAGPARDDAGPPLSETPGKGECLVPSIKLGITEAALQFSTGSTNPADAGTSAAEAASVISSRHLTVEVEGHADPAEGDASLARKRAQRVIDLLIQHGVNPKQLILADKGMTGPPEGVERNSRVTFRIRYDLTYLCR